MQRDAAVAARGEADHPEHQVAHHLGRPAHPYGATAMVVLQGCVDPFRGAAFAPAYVFCHAMPDLALPLCLLRQFLLQSRGGTRIDVDDRNMIEVAAVLPDLGNIVGAVRQIIQVGNPRGGHGGERNGDPGLRRGRLWLSCADAAVSTQLMGISPSALSMCSL